MPLLPIVAKSSGVTPGLVTVAHARMPPPLPCKELAAAEPLMLVKVILLAALPRAGLLMEELPPATKLTVAPEVEVRTRLPLLSNTVPNEVFAPPAPLTEVMVEWP